MSRGRVYSKHVFFLVYFTSKTVDFTSKWMAFSSNTVDWTSKKVDFVNKNNDFAGFKQQEQDFGSTVGN